jgi:ATP-dependent DNA helicase RecG
MSTTQTLDTGYNDQETKAWECLKSIGVQAAHEALLILPSRHKDYKTVVDAFDLAKSIGQTVCIDLVVVDPPKTDGKEVRFILTARDVAGRIHKLMVFGTLHWSPWKKIKANDFIRITAKVVEFNGRPFLSSPELVKKEYWGRILPVYRGVPARISAEKVANAVQDAILDPHAIRDATIAIRQAFGGLMEEEIRLKIGLKWTFEKTLRAIHAPDTPMQAQGGLDVAKRLAVALIRHKAGLATQRELDAYSIIRLPEGRLAAIIQAMPFKMTCGEMSQESAVQEIIAGLEAPYPMDALLSADVGVGKTASYMVPSVGARSVGKKVAILIPNTILVQQVADEFRFAYPNTAVFPISEGTKSVNIPWDLKPILIGTTAMISVAREKQWVPDFLVIDESQKTSREQRDALRGPHTNVLETTATALPRTMALVMHGDKQLIQVSKHHATRVIHTEIVDPQHRAQMMQKIRQIIKMNGQVAMIYPRVTCSNGDDKKNVEEAAQSWEHIFPGDVAMLHGKMKPEDKLRAMSMVKSGEQHILIASSIIEIGVTIKNLQLLMVINADRYGVSTLHQMRGRLVRHGGEGWFYLYLPESIEDETMERLQLMKKTNDGFALAEMDMDLRGFGNLDADSEDQSGKSATIFRGLKLMPKDFE